MLVTQGACGGDITGVRSHFGLVTWLVFLAGLGMSPGLLLALVIHICPGWVAQGAWMVARGGTLGLSSVWHPCWGQSRSATRAATCHMWAA